MSPIVHLVGSWLVAVATTNNPLVLEASMAAGRLAKPDHLRRDLRGVTVGGS
jgi:hypothetical protein